MYTVSFDDPGSSFSAYYSEIQGSILAAGADWNKYLGGSNLSSIDIQVQFGPIPTANGRSAATQFVNTLGGFNIFEQGAAFEARTGIDLNGASPDATIEIGTAYLTNELWFDPDPLARMVPVP